MGKENVNELKRLYWKTDSEKIKELISTLPTKYLIGRINTCKRNVCADEKVNRIVPINWKGFTFTASQKTLEDELFRTNRKDEIYCLWTFHNQLGRCCRTYHYIGKEKYRKERKTIKRRINH